MAQTRALIDNTVFAGVMRLHSPDLQTHSTFLRDYPEHRQIDERSLAAFLTAIVVYGKILLEASSQWNERQMERRLHPRNTLGRGTLTWAGELIKLLPRDISSLLYVSDFSVSHNVSEYDSCQKAFDIMTSSFKHLFSSRDASEIPKVYYAADYVYRPVFVELNRQCADKLDDIGLARAMFLHRGLFLQAVAQAENCVYMPYHYRGEMLAQISPLLSLNARKGPSDSARLPLNTGKRPDENEQMHQLNECYYSIMETVSWQTYERSVPFIGAAILRMAKGNTLSAFEIALQLRNDGKVRRVVGTLNDAVRRNDRVGYESLLTKFHEELQAAARQLGAESTAQSGYKLVIAWLPRGYEQTLELIFRPLPDSLKAWARRTASTLVRKTPLQMLFLEHARLVEIT